jgi:hypothetical protein
MRNLLNVIAVLAAALAGYAFGHRSRDAGAQSDEAGPVVARFAGNALHAAGIEAQVGAQPDVLRARLATPEGRKEYVEELVRVELLAYCQSR